MDCLCLTVRVFFSAWQAVFVLFLVSAVEVVGCDFSSCGEFNICIDGGPMGEHEAVCSAARNADIFFRPLKLDFPDRLTIILSKRIPPNGDGLALGSYHPASNSVLLLDYQAAVAASKRTPPAFGVPMSPSLWRSYLVHEIAHAIVARHAVFAGETLAPTEYIASVAQLSVLHDSVLSSVLSNYRTVTAFRDEAEITDLYYFMKPCEFAVRAYLHYLQPENGQKFIRHLLDDGLPDSGAFEQIPFF